MKAEMDDGLLATTEDVSALASLGDYRIVRKLGGSNLGETYLAEHRFLKRNFVLKVLAAELTEQPGFLERFQHHVGVLAQLDHPHLVKIHNVSCINDHYFLVTDAIVDERGSSMHLGQFLASQGRRLDEGTLYEVLIQIADALDYAHGLDLDGVKPIHRGLKLSNVLVRQGPSHPEVYVSDFGISPTIGAIQAIAKNYATVLSGVARAELQATLATNMEIDAPGEAWHLAALESLAFLAPEQKRAEGIRVTTAADAYAFGVLAYTIITGEIPDGMPAMPSELVPDYHSGWDGLIRQCMQVNPQRRPGSLVAAVKAAQQPSVTTSVRPSVPTSEYRTTHELRGERTADLPTDALQPLLRAGQLERPEIDLHPERAFQVDSTVKVYQPVPKQISEVEPLLTEMVVIAGGNYWRGSNDGKRDEVPRHRISLVSFAIDIQPVTNEQFVRFLAAMGGEKDSFHRDLIRLRDSRIKRSGGKLSIESGYHKHPVVGVTWYGAAAYAKWVGKRLPTEAEWEIAASGAGGEWPYATGENVDKSLANYFSADTTAVTAYPPNALGLYDFAGNVYEWCYDWYDYNYYEKALQEPDNPTGPVQGVYRVLRGGCWKSLKEDLRCSRRHRNNPGTVNGTYGFRCAADVEPLKA